MRQIWSTKAGPPEVLAVREAADPEPGPKEVRIRVRAAGINFADLMARVGLYPDAPKIPCVVGYEVAGVVDAVGKDVTRFRGGERVFGMPRFGGYTDTLCVNEAQAFRMPDAMSFEEGAALPVVYLTAHHMMLFTGHLRPRSRVLVHSAAGGVGLAAIQLAKTRDCEIFGIASRSKHGFLKEQGVQHTIDNDADYASVVRAATGGRGVDLVLDPVGGKKSVRVDIRVISATNKSLLEQVKRGEFREDLYYRLNVFPITLPPLRQRREDIGDLARGFLARFAAEEGRKLSGISSEAVALISSYDWPGNVRQLENAVFRAVVLADGPELGVAEFPQIAAQMEGYDVRIPPAPAPLARPDGEAEPAPRIIHMPVRDPNALELLAGSDLRKLDELEREIITFALQHYRGHMSEVSRRLGIGRSTLYRKLKDYGLIESETPPDETDAA